MATTYNWNCKTVDVYPQDGDYTDVVFNVHWILTGEDADGINATVIGTQTLDVSEITDFTPFDQLTNEQASAWVEAAMGEEQVSSLKESIDKQIADKINPPVVTMHIGGGEEESIV